MDQADNSLKVPEWKETLVDYSYAQAMERQCPSCQQISSQEVWLIIDQTARPDLVQSIIEESFNSLVCPHCNQAMGVVDQPLLIYRPNQQPPLLFTHADATALAEDQAHEMQHLVQHLLEALDNSDDEWVMEGLKRVPRHRLMEFLKQTSEDHDE